MSLADLAFGRFRASDEHACGSAALSRAALVAAHATRDHGGAPLPLPPQHHRHPLPHALGAARARRRTPHAANKTDHLPRPARAQGDFIDEFAELTAPDDSVKDAAAMTKLIQLLEAPGAKDSSSQQLVVASLRATTDPALLESFTNSTALKEVNEWCTRAVTPATASTTLELLALLAHLPITVKAMQASGIGKTINKLRKAEDEKVQGAAGELLKKWKGLLSAAPADGAGAAKRKAGDADADAATAKRAKPADAPTMLADDSSLDLALSAQAPRKASLLKPDHMKPRRPSQQVDLTPTNNRSKTASAASAASSAPAAASSSSVLPSVMVPSRTPPPAAARSTSSSDTTVESTPASPGIALTASMGAASAAGSPLGGGSSSARKVSFAPTDSLVEVREYEVEDRRGAVAEAVRFSALFCVVFCVAHPNPECPKFSPHSPLPPAVPHTPLGSPPPPSPCSSSSATRTRRRSRRSASC